MHFRTTELPHYLQPGWNSYAGHVIDYFSQTEIEAPQTDAAGKVAAYVMRLIFAVPLISGSAVIDLAKWSGWTILLLGDTVFTVLRMPFYRRAESKKSSFLPLPVIKVHLANFTSSLCLPLVTLICAVFGNCLPGSDRMGTLNRIAPSYRNLLYYQDKDPYMYHKLKDFLQQKNSPKNILKTIALTLQRPLTEVSKQYINICVTQLKFGNPNGLSKNPDWAKHSAWKGIVKTMRSRNDPLLNQAADNLTQLLAPTLTTASASPIPARL